MNVAQICNPFPQHKKKNLNPNSNLILVLPNADPNQNPMPNQILPQLLTLSHPILYSNLNTNAKL